MSGLFSWSSVWQGIVGRRPPYPCQKAIKAGIVPQRIEFRRTIDVDELAGNIVSGGSFTEVVGASALNNLEKRYSENEDYLEIISINSARAQDISFALSFVEEGSAQEAALDEILHFSSSMEDIGDIVAHGLSRLAKKRLYRGVQFSKEGQEELVAAHEELLKLLRLVLRQFADGNKGYQKQISKRAGKLKKLYSQSLTNHRRRLSNQKTLSIGTSSIHQDVLRDLLTIAFRLEFFTDSDYRTSAAQ